MNSPAVATPPPSAIIARVDERDDVGEAVAQIVDPVASRPPSRDRRRPARPCGSPSSRASPCGTSSSVLRGNDGASASAWRISPVPEALRLEAADLSAAADEAVVRADLVVADFAGAPRPPSSSPPPRDDAAADPGAQRQQHEISARLCRPERVLAERRAARVVADEHRQLERAAQTCSPSATSFQPKFGRVAHRAGLEVDVAGRADADADDVLLLGVGQRLAHHFARAPRRPRRAVIGDVPLVLGAWIVPSSSTTVAITCEPPRSTPIASHARRPFALGRADPPSVANGTAMQETIDLIAHRDLRNLRRFTRAPGSRRIHRAARSRADDHVKTSRSTKNTSRSSTTKRSTRYYNANEITPSRVGVQVQRRSRVGRRPSRT